MLRSIVFCLIIACPIWASAAVLVTGVNSTNETEYQNDVSATDLVNDGQSTLDSIDRTAGYLFGPADNDGLHGGAGGTGNITFWNNATGTKVITFDLDTSVNSDGYDITSLRTINAWSSNSGDLKNQHYTVAVSTVLGGASFTDVTTVAYAPFPSTTVGGATKVDVTEDVTGILASGVDQIRFTYNIQSAGPAIREIDVFGAPTVAAPVYDIGTDATITFAAGDTLSNTGNLTAWTDATLKFNEGSDFTGVDFTALGISSWTTARFASGDSSPPIVYNTIWDGADLSGLTLNFNATNNNIFGDSFVGADLSGSIINLTGNQPFLFSNFTNASFVGATFNHTSQNIFRAAVLTGADFTDAVFGTALSVTGQYFNGGPGTTSVADKANAVNFSGVDFSNITGAARTALINNLGAFDGGTPIGAFYSASTLSKSAVTAATLDAAGWQAIQTHYIGDSAAEGTSVTAGDASYGLTTLTIAMHTGSPVIYTAPSDQDLRITQVNFQTHAAGTVTPFVARYDGTNSTQGSGYEILAIGDPLTVAAGGVLENRAFTVSGLFPTISVGSGDQIIAGYLQTGGQVIRLGEVTQGLGDYIRNGDSLTGQTVGDPLSANTSFGFDKTMKFNIGFEVTSGGVDATDPLIGTLSPADDAVDVSVDGDLTVTFNEAIGIGSGDISIKNLDAPSQTDIPVGDAQVSVSGAVLTINPSTDLDSGTNYAVQIAATAIDDLAGNSFAGITDDTTWNFSTETVTSLATSSPVERQVVQRDGSDLGTIPVEGTVSGSVDRIEARAVQNLGAIWFIGDSITQSNADGDGNGSPRKSLYDLLEADGANYTYTGDFAANVDGLPTTGGTVETNLYHYHSGHSGIRIGEVGGEGGFATNLTSYWGSGRLNVVKPNQILIMLGTNDVASADPAGASERLRQLVEDIYALPDIGKPTIFLASIPPNGRNASDTAYVVAFNADVPGIVADFQAEGKDVQFVDQFTPLNDDYANTMRADDLHPNATGNDTIAQTWFDAIKARYAVTGSGTNTAWQTIATNPVGSFAGSLANVDAGGWYSVEVRSILSELPVDTVTIDKVGVGDIYVTAGQSNSANFGSPAATPADDRVVARTSASANAWAIADDPLPIANGTGGSTWSRLGDLLVEAENVPVGFVAVGSGGTSVSSWVPGQSNYDNRLKPAVESFPVDGFRAVLWHQGEVDSAGAGLSAATYEGHLNTMISGSRTDAGWSIPWYIAEASFAGRTIEKEDRVTAGQRAGVHGDPLVFLGPSTDEFHLEDAAGGKLADNVHFNAAGLLDHATQWSEILGGTTTIRTRNGDFEDNRTASITGLSALADGAVHLVDILDGDSPMVLDWRILATSGVDSADGSNGFHNPTTGTYAGAVDSSNGGVLPNMDGLHVAMLDGGTAGNYFLQSTRVATAADTVYTLTVALGVRDSSASYGNARLEITSNGVVVASASFDKTALDALNGSDASGSFTDASVSWVTGNSVPANQLLAIRVVKEGGAGTVIDFDNVRFVSADNNFANYIAGFELGGLDGFSDDPDGDGLTNGIEDWFGTHPGEFDAGLAGLATDGTTTTFTHPQAENPSSDVSGFYQWSPNLTDWYESGNGSSGGPTVTLSPVTVGTTTTVTATASESLDRLFLRAGAVQD